MPRPARGNQEQQVRNLDEATLKTRIIQNLQRRRQTYLDGLDDGIGEDRVAVPTELEEDSWLDAEHVDIAIQTLVSERDHLKNNVGICPVYNADITKEIAQNLAIDYMRGQAEYARYFLPQEPLPSAVGLRGQALADREKEAKRRDRLHQLINKKANILVGKENLNERLFFMHLESITNTPSLMGNPAKRNMPFRDCQQLIIPIRHNDNHYTVAVVNLTTKREKGRARRIADIKYYDSQGGDMDEELKGQLAQFLTSKGYEPLYENQSFEDQREGYNCAIFASYGAIDLANLNAKNDERFLESIDSLNEEEYKERLDALRLETIVKLMQRMNITLSPDYIKQIKEGANKVQKQSKSVHKREQLNRKINKIREEIEDLLNRVKGKTATRSKRKTAKKLSEMQPKELLAECAGLVKQLKTKQEQINKKRTKNNQDKANLRDIAKVLKKYHENFASLRNQTQRENGRLIPALDDVKGLFGNTSVAALGFYTAVSLLGLIFGVPYLSALLHGVANFVGSSTVLQVMAGLACFGGFFWVAQSGLGMFAKENNDNDDVTPDEIMELEETDEDESEDLDESPDESPDETPGESADNDKEADSDDDEEANVDKELDEVVQPGRRGYTPLQQSKTGGKRQQTRKQPQPARRNLRKR